MGILEDLHLYANGLRKYAGVPGNLSVSDMINTLNSISGKDHVWNEQSSYSEVLKSLADKHRDVFHTTDKTTVNNMASQFDFNNHVIINKNYNSTEKPPYYFDLSSYQYLRNHPDFYFSLDLDFKVPSLSGQKIVVSIETEFAGSQVILAMNNGTTNGKNFSLQGISTGQVKAEWGAIKSLYIDVENAGKRASYAMQLNAISISVMLYNHDVKTSFSGGPEITLKDGLNISGGYYNLFAVPNDIMIPTNRVGHSWYMVFEFNNTVNVSSPVLGTIKLQLYLQNGGSNMLTNEMLAGRIVEKGTGSSATYEVVVKIPDYLYFNNLGNFTINCDINPGKLVGIKACSEYQYNYKHLANVIKHEYQLTSKQDFKITDYYENDINSGSVPGGWFYVKPSDMTYLTYLSQHHTIRTVLNLNIKSDTDGTITANWMGQNSSSVYNVKSGQAVQIPIELPLIANKWTHYPMKVSLIKSGLTNAVIDGSKSFINYSWDELQVAKPSCSAQDDEIHGNVLFDWDLVDNLAGFSYTQDGANVVATNSAEEYGKHLTYNGGSDSAYNRIYFDSPRLTSDLTAYIWVACSGTGHLQIGPYNALSNVYPTKGYHRYKVSLTGNYQSTVCSLNVPSDGRNVDYYIYRIVLVKGDNYVISKSPNLIAYNYDTRLIKVNANQTLAVYAGLLPNTDYTLTFSASSDNNQDNYSFISISDLNGNALSDYGNYLVDTDGHINTINFSTDNDDSPYTLYFKSNSGSVNYYNVCLKVTNTESTEYSDNTLNLLSNQYQSFTLDNSKNNVIPISNIPQGVYMLSWNSDLNNSVAQRLNICLTDSVTSTSRLNTPNYYRESGKWQYIIFENCYDTSKLFMTDLDLGNNDKLHLYNVKLSKYYGLYDDFKGYQDNGGTNLLGDTKFPAFYKDKNGNNSSGSFNSFDFSTNFALNDSSIDKSDFYFWCSNSSSGEGISFKLHSNAEYEQSVIVGSDKRPLEVVSDISNVVNSATNIYDLGNNKYKIVTHFNSINGDSINNILSYHVNLDSSATYFTVYESCLSLVSNNALFNYLSPINMHASGVTYDSSVSYDNKSKSFHFKGNNGSANIIQLSNKLLLNPGSTYILTFVANGTGTIRSYIYPSSTSDNYFDNASSYSLSAIGNAYSYKFTYSDAFKDNNNPLSLSIRPGNSDSSTDNTECTISDLCLIKVG